MTKFIVLVNNPVKELNFSAAPSPNLSPIHFSVASTALYPQSIKVTKPLRILPPMLIIKSAVVAKNLTIGINLGRRGNNCNPNHPKRTVPTYFCILPQKLLILPGTGIFIPFPLVLGASTSFSCLDLSSCSCAFLFSSAALFSAARVPFNISSIFITFVFITNMGSSCFPPIFAREELCFLIGTKLVLGRTANDPPSFPCGKNF